MSKFAFLGVALTKRAVVVGLVTAAAVVGAGFGFVLPALDGPNAATDLAEETTQDVTSTATTATTDAGPPTADGADRSDGNDDAGTADDTQTLRPETSDDGVLPSSDRGGRDDQGRNDGNEGDGANDGSDGDGGDESTTEASSDDASVVVTAESNATVASRPAVGPAVSAVVRWDAAFSG
ncbi:MULTISPECIES: hypothetical protein [Halorussus]|uniref:hypothetical protein n=1 Tax=Halorussus TaxID=1070314 RepID=UPI00209D3BCE|nr:hypothetical protein [Halorussus vallis]USZ75323.1 hypothetical protein NGM07_18055 [Halorussus vallis]